MNQIIQIELWIVLIFASIWLVGSLANWVMLGLLTRMATELRKIMESWSKDKS